jgi:hypothetical protein
MNGWIVACTLLQWDPCTSSCKTKEQFSANSHTITNLPVVDYISVEVPEILTAVVMKSSIFSDITLCSPLRVNWCIGATRRLHLQGQRISQARNQREADRMLCASSWSFSLSSLIMKDATYSPKTSVGFQWTTQHYTPQERTLHFSSLRNTVCCVAADEWWRGMIQWNLQLTLQWSLIYPLSVQTHCLNHDVLNYSIGEYSF